VIRKSTKIRSRPDGALTRDTTPRGKRKGSLEHPQKFTDRFTGKIGIFELE
jgi:hypothetical protein